MFYENELRFLCDTFAKCFVSVENGVARVDFETPVRAVTPGQSAVFYKGDTVAFGGLIR